MPASTASLLVLGSSSFIVWLYPSKSSGVVIPKFFHQILSMALSRPPGFFITEKIQTTYHKLLPLVSLPTQESWCSASFILFLLIQRKKHFRLLSNCSLNYLPSAPFTLTVSLSDLFLFGFKYSQVSEMLKKTSVAHCNTISLLNFHSLSDISDVPQAASSPTARSRPDFWVWLGSQKLVPWVKRGRNRDKKEQECGVERLPEANKKQWRSPKWKVGNREEARESKLGSTARQGPQRGMGLLYEKFSQKLSKKVS